VKTILLAALLGGGLTAAGASPDLPVKVGQTVEITLSHARCWFPTVHRFRSGVIMVTMQMAADQIDAEAELSAFCVSRDNGMTWSRRYTMGEEASADGAWSEEPDSQDRIWWWGNYPEPRRPGDDRSFLVPLAKYADGGQVITIDRNVVLNTAEPIYPGIVWLFDYLFDRKVPVTDSRQTTQYGVRAWGDIIHGPDGALLSDGYLTAAKDEKERSVDAFSRKIRNVVFRSADNGRTWAEYGTIAAVPDSGRPEWMGEEGPNEGSLELLKDGRLYAIYRTSGHGMIGNSWSSDGGKTWTPPAPIGFQGVAPRLHRLSNGMLGLVTGRPDPVEFRYNPDGNGEHWSKPVVIFTGKSTHYNDFTEVAPGKLLVVYDSTPYGWNEIPFADRDTKNTIFGTFVEFGTK